MPRYDKVLPPPTRPKQPVCISSSPQSAPPTGRRAFRTSTASTKSKSTSRKVPTGLQLGLGRIGFHTFRHTYRAWLDETGAPVGVQQKLMRHAHISTTMDHYGNASTLAKRKANRPLVQRLLRRSASEQVTVQKK